MLKINREHMLELTRRMTVSRTAMTRIANVLICWLINKFLKSADKAKNIKVPF